MPKSTEYVAPKVVGDKLVTTVHRVPGDAVLTVADAEALKAKQAEPQRAPYCYEAKDVASRTPEENLASRDNIERQ